MPLLDVLLCTMGTLIVILGVLNREARYHPAKRLPGKAANAAKAEELKNAQEDLQLVVDQLNTAHEKTLVDLQNSRARLSGIEDSSRQLEDKFHSLESAVKQIEAGDDADSAKRDQLRLEAVQLNTKRMQLDSDLQKGRANARSKQPVYAVVPFEGMYKTSRRPIYIECRGDSVILQPEGIVFSAADFLGPGGPGNPLAAALRAAQEYWRNAPRNDPNLPNEPYPLLLVRPDGIIAYYLVRDAMTSWDAEFGYELIGADWKLDFPMQVVPQLQEMETRAVADARERLQWLAQASPELFQRKASKVQYHVSPFRGGAVRDGGPSLGNDPFADDPLGGFGKAGSNPNSGVANGMGSANGVPGGINGGGGLGNGNIPGGGGNLSGGSGGRYADGRGNAAFGFGGTGSNSPGGTNNQPGGALGGRPLGGGLNSPGGRGGTGSGGGLGSTPGGLAGGLPGDANSAFGGSGTGIAGGQNGGGPELAAIGPRYAGAGNNLGDGDGSQFAPGMSDGGQSGGGQFAGGQSTGGQFAGGQSAGGQFTGQGSGGGSPGQSSAGGSGNGMSGPPNTKFGNYQGGAAGSLSTSGTPGGGLTSSEYGGVMLPGSAGGYVSAGSMGSGAGSAASGMASGAGAGNSMNGTPMSGTAMNGSAMAGGASGSPGGSDSSAGGGSSGSSSSASGSSGGMQSASASGSQNADPQAGGMPSLEFNMTPQQQETYEQQLQQQQQQQQNTSSQRSAKLHRQRNWALPNSSASSVPIQRPIRVECWNDRLVLLPDTRDMQAEVIPLPERTADAVDQLVAAVRTYTKTWGIAGRGMYWKPQLILEVTPNGQGRAADLTEILADSGWDVKRK
jgi:chemotaxis regulatin CheY-phosphate phosphatase CheZ